MHLSSITIENYKGIKYQKINFNKDINVIIGENGTCKTALIDAIRLLYNLGSQQKELFVFADDFYLEENIITISYDFSDLSLNQKGALYEYLVLGVTENEDIARITLTYKKVKQKILFNYFTGEVEGQRADNLTFQYFLHYYLGALRDSTKDLLTNRNSILGNLIHRQIEFEQTQDNYESLIKNANDELLKLNEVKNSKTFINTNLESIYKFNIENQIGLRIDGSKAENIVKIIKPYLPHDKQTLTGDGFNLNQNSLGFNNLIYIATILGDINQQLKDDKVSHSALLIEEPEAHLHPQLQLNLFNFLKQANLYENSQLFITTHSPTLTSKVPLNNLIHLSKGNIAINIGECFEGRETIKIEEEIEDEEEKVTFVDDTKQRKKQLERYIDVTKSQLFFSQGVLFVEGMSEELLVPVFSEILEKKLEDYKIELVNADGTSFYPFIYLFNSPDELKSLSIPLSILTDDDRFPHAKNVEYSFKNIKKDLSKATELYENIQASNISKRIANITELIKSSPNKISLNTATKTFEFAIVQANISNSKEQIRENLLWKYLNNDVTMKSKMKIIQAFLDNNTEFDNKELNNNQLHQLQILIWKALPKKTEFAQNFSVFLLENMIYTKKFFFVPDYIQKSINHLVNYEK